MNENNEQLSECQLRLGVCEVCNADAAKYTCPECEVKTCSLPCVKIHKKELECSGIRNKVKFKQLKSFTNMDFHSDYMLLEAATRATDTFKKVGYTLQNSTFYSVPRMKIKRACYKRNIHLHYLPKTFTRHKTNSTYYDWKKDKIFWKVEWYFPESSMANFVDERVPETDTLSASLEKYIHPEKSEGSVKKLLTNYHNNIQREIAVILKGERTSPPKFYLMDKDETLMENLSDKNIIENPIFYVIFSESLPQYSVDNSVCKREANYSSNYKGINLLFDSNIEEQD